MTTLLRVDTLDQLLELTGDHPVAAVDVGRGFEAPAWAAEDERGRAAVFSRRSDHGVPGAAALGDAGGLDALLGADEVREWFTGGGAQHLSTPRGLMDVALRHLPLGESGGDWDWMWTTSPPPPVPGEDRVVELGESAVDELVGFLATHSPRSHGQPFARPGQRWVGVRDGSGRLLACGASEPSQGGTPTLAGIAVDRTRRRVGLGAAVSAELTRWAVSTAGVCALGMFADNDAARRVYTRLGFVTGMQWRSRWLPRRTPPRPPG